MVGISIIQADDATPETYIIDGEEYWVLDNTSHQFMMKEDDSVRGYDFFKELEKKNKNITTAFGEEIGQKAIDGNLLIFITDQNTSDYFKELISIYGNGNDNYNWEKWGVHGFATDYNSTSWLKYLKGSIELYQEGNLIYSTDIVNATKKDKPIVSTSDTFIALTFNVIFNPDLRYTIKPKLYIKKLKGFNPFFESSVNFMEVVFYALEGGPSSHSNTVLFNERYIDKGEYDKIVYQNAFIFLYDLKLDNENQ